MTFKFSALWSFNSVCNCTCYGVDICVRMFVCRCSGPHISVLGIFPNHSLPFFVRQVISLNLDASDFARLVDQQALFHLPSVGIHCLSFFFGLMSELTFSCLDSKHLAN